MALHGVKSKPAFPPLPFSSLPLPPPLSMGEEDAFEASPSPMHPFPHASPMLRRVSTQGCKREPWHLFFVPACCLPPVPFHCATIVNEDRESRKIRDTGLPPGPSTSTHPLSPHPRLSSSLLFWYPSRRRIQFASFSRLSAAEGLLNELLPLSILFCLPGAPSEILVSDETSSSESL